MSRYPKASWLGNGRSGGSYIDVPARFVVHTTETVSVPNYDDGRAAPHLTYDPSRRVSYQHTDTGIASRALRNKSGGVQTNRARAIQLEIVCYSDKRIADQNASRLWVGDLSQEHYEDVADIVRWAAEEHGIYFDVRMPRPVPKYGEDSPARMSASEWNKFNGICGHFEVPENSHWDPGAFDFIRLLDILQGETMPTPIPLRSWAVKSFEWAIANKIYLHDGPIETVRETEEFQRFIVFLLRYHQNAAAVGSSGISRAEAVNLIETARIKTNS